MSDFLGSFFWDKHGLFAWEQHQAAQGVRLPAEYLCALQGHPSTAPAAVLSLQNVAGVPSTPGGGAELFSAPDLRTVWGWLWCSLPVGCGHCSIRVR